VVEQSPRLNNNDIQTSLQQLDFSRRQLDTVSCGKGLYTVHIFIFIFLYHTFLKHIYYIIVHTCMHALHYIALHCITLHYIRLDYITLHYISCIYMIIYTYGSNHQPTFLMSWKHEFPLHSSTPPRFFGPRSQGAYQLRIVRAYDLWKSEKNRSVLGIYIYSGIKTYGILWYYGDIATIGFLSRI